MTRANHLLFPPGMKRVPANRPGNFCRLSGQAFLFVAFFANPLPISYFGLQIIQAGHMTEAKQIQKAFIQKVRGSFPSNQSFVDELAELLNTSNDSAYRRIRGETLLGIDEIALICRHFRVAFEPFALSSETATFSYHKLRDDPDGFSRWFGNLLGHVKRIASLDDNEIIYAADDVPIWHHFNSGHLICFKLFYWQKSILNLPRFADLSFAARHIDPDLVETARSLLAHYNMTCSTEIWTEDTLNSTLKQVEYYWESGFFKDKDEALQLCDDIDREVMLLKQKAESKQKIPGGKENFTLYQSEVMVGNNSILVKAGGSKTVFISNNTFNAMSTQDQGFVEETETWLANITRRSVLISGVNEKQRNKFFRTLQGKIDGLRTLIG